MGKVVPTPGGKTTAAVLDVQAESAVGPSLSVPCRGCGIRFDTRMWQLVTLRVAQVRVGHHAGLRSLLCAGTACA